MVSSAKRERNLGIELLRIITTFSILVLHTQGMGGLLDQLTFLSPKYEAAWALETLCYYVITTYGMISGYVGLNGRYRISNIVYLWLQVMFFSLVGNGIYMILDPSVRHSGTVFTMLFPTMTGQFWYFTAYLLVFLMMPLVKAGFEHLPKKILDFIFIAILVFLSTMDIIFNTNIFCVDEGYSATWLLASYFMGMYVKKFEFGKNIKTKVLVGIFFLSMALTWLSKLAIDLFLGFDPANPEKGNRLLRLNSPTMVICSIALLLIFSRVNLGGKMANVVRKLSPYLFGVYLTNCCPVVWMLVLKDRFAKYAEYPAPIMILLVLLITVAIFLGGVVVDGIRYIIFSLARVKERLSILEDRIMGEKCPCCGQSQVGKYEICGVCGWENDPVQKQDPDFKGGANKDSLNEHREEFMRNLTEIVAQKEKQ